MVRALAPLEFGGQGAEEVPSGVGEDQGKVVRAADFEHVVFSEGGIDLAVDHDGSAGVYAFGVDEDRLVAADDDRPQRQRVRRDGADGNGLKRGFEDRAAQ